VLAGFEKRPAWSYGFQKTGDAGRRYIEGVILGVLAFGIVGALMYAFDGFTIHGFNLHGSQWLVYPVLWLGVMVLVGFGEEMLFRGYGLYALARGIGFWPAAAVMTLLFGAAHLGKEGENIVDIASVLFIGMFLCFTLWRTGSLWLAAGFHFAVDYMQFFIIGTRNGSAVPLGHLLNSSFPGPAWVNGGALGTEASYFVFPVVALLFVVVHLLHPKVRFTIAAETQPSHVR
jgi:membrane protease YdiL (CAAX protease family)